MPLSQPLPRRPLHRRLIDVHGYEREDSLWDIEGRLLDTRTYDFESLAHGLVRAQQPLHAMWLRITVDLDFLIHDAEAAIDNGPFPACPSGIAEVAKLKGVRIGRNFHAEVRRLLIDSRGCTHLTEMLIPIASTALQTLWPLRETRAAARGTGGKPPVIDSCHALRGDGQAVRQLWPQYYIPTPD